MDNLLFDQIESLTNSHWWFLGRKKIIETVIRNHTVHNSSMNILDFGCGTGQMIPLLRQYGQVTGIEPNAYAAQMANNKGFTISQDDINKITESQFDLITVLDVLEHIQEDFPTINQLIGKLKSGGYLLITVPAYMSLWSKHDLEHQHFRRYSKKYLNSLLKETDGEIIYQTYFNSLLFPLIFLIRRIKNNLINSQSDMREVNYFLNKLLLSIFKIENKLINRKLSFSFGVSYLILFRKK